MSISTRTKLKVGILGGATLITGLLMLSFLWKGEMHSDPGKIVQATPVRVTIKRRGEVAGRSYNAMNYAIAVEGANQPFSYQQADIDSLNHKYRVGDPVKVSWRRRGVFGKTEVVEVSN